MSSPIKNCRRLFRFRCPRTWDNLTPTSIEAVRFCGSCRKNVYFCETEEEAQRHAGQCIAMFDEELYLIEGMYADESDLHSREILEMSAEEIAAIHELEAEDLADILDDDEPPQA